MCRISHWERQLTESLQPPSQTKHSFSAWISTSSCTIRARVSSAMMFHTATPNIFWSKELWPSESVPTWNKCTISWCKDDLFTHSAMALILTLSIHIQNVFVFFFPGSLAVKKTSNRDFIVVSRGKIWHKFKLWLLSTVQPYLQYKMEKWP